MASSPPQLVTGPRTVVDGVPAYLVLAFVVLSVVLIGNEIIRWQARIPGMKGPRGMPILGNLAEVRSDAAAKCQEWAKTYGPVYQVQLGNTPVVVVNGAAAAKALFVGHSLALSSRPLQYTFHKIASSTAGLTIGTSPYDDSLKKRKRALASALNRPAIQSYVPYLDLESRTFIEDLLTYGQAGKAAIDPLRLVQRLSLSLVMTINWGVRVASHTDPLFGEIVHVEEELNRFRSVTGNVQDHVPLLRLNPISPSSAKAREMRGRRDGYLHALNDELADKVRRGADKACIQANVMRNGEAKLSHVELVSISLSILGGGFETVSNTVHWTMAYLAKHPDLQDAAFDAIRDFQGGDEEPLCDAGQDIKCRYVAALTKEALRYFSVVPLGLPRESISEIEYEGVRIPKGTTVYLNAFACNYDDELWTDPDVFRPERWLEQPEAPLFTLGLGHRMCVGHLLAQRVLYIIFMRLLSSFRIVGTGDAIGCDPRRDSKNARDLVLGPNSYRVACVPRNEARLRDALENACGGKE